MTVDLAGETAGITFDVDYSSDFFGKTALRFGNVQRVGADRVMLTGTQGDDILLADQGVGASSVGTIASFDGGAGFDTYEARIVANGSTLTVADDGGITSSFVALRDVERFVLAVDASDAAVRTGAADDRITVTGQDNSVAGQGGADTISATHASGANSLGGGDGNDSLTGGSGADLLSGGNGIDQLAGGAVADQIFGGAGRDLLTGGAGDDRLVGGVGADRLLGGAGADTFAYTNRADFAAGGRDTILDFHQSEGDRIDLSAIDTDLRTTGDQAVAFIGSDGFSGSGSAELRVVHRAGDTVLLQGDLDGDGRANVTVLVHADAPLVAADFML